LIFIIVEEELPLKQGLKPKNKRDPGGAGVVEEELPLKQGLKQIVNLTPHQINFG